MTAAKDTYRKLSDTMAKYHIRSIYLLIILYVIVVGIVKPSFLQPDNWMNLLRSVSVYGIISCGITFVMLTGRTDLSAGMMLTFLAAISCYFVTPGIENQLLAIAVPILLGAVGGLVNGILVGVIRLNSFVSTLGMMSLYTGFVLLFIKQSPSLFGSQDMTVYRFLGQGSVLGIPTPVIILAIVAIVSSIVLRRTVYGARIYACSPHNPCGRVWAPDRIRGADLRGGEQRLRRPLFRHQPGGHHRLRLHRLRPAHRAGRCGDVLPHPVRPAEDGLRL